MTFATQYAIIKELMGGISVPQGGIPLNIITNQKGIKGMKKLISILMALVLALALLPATVFAADEVAQIGTTKYSTLQEAFKNVKKGETIELLKDADGDGIVVPSGSSFTVDFKGFTFDITGKTVGSTGTATEAFQLLKDSTITFKNGKITSAKAKMLIQNYCNLTLENMVLDGANLAGNQAYTMSNNCGNVVIKDTTIIAKENGVAFDVYGGFGNYGDVGVTVTGKSVINGTVEVARGSGTQNKNTLKVENGTVNGKLKVDKNDKTTVSVIAGTFASDVSDYVDTSASSLEKVNGQWVVKKNPGAAKIGDTEYETLAEAIAAAKAGDTVVLQRDVDITDMITIKTALTIDLGGNTASFAGFGFVLAKGSDVTLKNGTVKAGTSAVWASQGANVVIAKDAKLHSAKNGALVLVNTGTTATVYGTVEADSDSAISGVGNEKDGGVIINIEDGAVVKCDNGIGIYFPNTSELNIKGGTITGATGVYVKSGKTTVTGGTIIGTGAKDDYKFNGNGADATGDAFVVDTCGYPGGDPAVEIKGGTFKSENAEAVGSYFGNTAEKALTGFITGGSFSSDPTKYAAADYKVTTENGVFTVSKDGGNPPKTFDAGIAVYGVSAILSVTGMAWMGSKKKNTYAGKRLAK